MQSALAQVGIAKQSAKGTAAANPTFAHGLTDGAVLTVDVAQDAEERTSGVRANPGINRTGVMPGMDFTGRAHPKSVGLYAYAAMGGLATTGAGPYTHVITLADSLPYLSGFGKLNSSIFKVQDFKVDSLGFSFNENEPVEMAVSGMGTVIDFAATFTPTTDETIGTESAYYIASAGTFKLDVDSATAVTAKIQSGEISISNNLEAIMLSGSVSPSDVFEGRQDVECSFDLVIDNLDEWRTIITGTAGGTSVSATPIFGSFEVVFTSGTASLKLAATQVAFITDFPDADPAGGPVVLSLSGVVVRPASGSPLTITAINGTTSY